MYNCWHTVLYVNFSITVHAWVTLKPRIHYTQQYKSYFCFQLNESTIQIVLQWLLLKWKHVKKLSTLFSRIHRQEIRVYSMLTALYSNYFLLIVNRTSKYTDRKKIGENLNFHSRGGVNIHWNFNFRRFFLTVYCRKEGRLSLAVQESRGRSSTVFGD